MKLEKVLENLKYEILQGSLDIEINSIEEDSRKLVKGSLFIAIKGYTVDGHDFIEKAIENGASAIVVTKDIEVNKEITLVKVEDDKEALALIAANFYDHPSSKLDLIGITGTNGKTSISYMLKSILEANNKKIGLIGTMGSIIDGELVSNKNTTPESLEIEKQINSMVKTNTDISLMEVSSHSLNDKVKRVSNLDFKIGIFTNLTEDHLDFHPTMEDYFNDKKKLFNMTSKLNIINNDDSYGKRLIKDLKNTNTKLLTYGLDKNSDIYASNIKIHNKGVDYLLNTSIGNIEISMNLLGKFNIYNSLAAVGVGLYYGFSLENIKLGLEKLEEIKGRFDLVELKEEKFSVIIDFAHTPDGLEQVLSTIDEFSEGRTIVVFGAGGNRDKSKRPIMGETVGKHADIPIVTSDNPRFEDPEEIIKDIIVGVEKYNKNYVKITDRKEAIKYALEIAKDKDTILLAGKGHETYTIKNGKTFPFDEKEIVLELVSEMKGEK